MPAIVFFEEDINYKLKHKVLIRQWLSDAIAAEGFKLSALSYIFCSDPYLLSMNRQFLDHDTFTDIISFDNSELDSVLSGDIFISLDRIRENAIKYNVTDSDELHRVMIHGALHLLGYGDKSIAEKQQMTEKENFYLAKRNFK